jgi:hypothetical protein
MHAPLVGTSANCRYVADRLAEGIAPATAKLQMTHLHKMFRLAERAGKAILPLFPMIPFRMPGRDFLSGATSKPFGRICRSRIGECLLLHF